MAFIGNKTGNKSDMVVTLFALFSILIAGGISIATITTNNEIESEINVNIYEIDPLIRAEQAAMAGIDAAKGHIQCHGIVDPGGLPNQYYANGARFEAVWDEINLKDSTVHVVSTGFCQTEKGEEFTTKYESIIKVNLIATHDQAILQDFYKANHNR